MKKLCIILILVVVAVWGFFLLRNTSSPVDDNLVACTMEAKLCPDGTAVGRTGPNCEFAACPNQELFGEVVVGETETINGVQITLDSIVEDSRCPIDAVCIQAGRLVVRATLSTAVSHGTIDVGTDKSGTFGDYEVSIALVSPNPLADQSISPENYRVTFKIEKN